MTQKEPLMQETSKPSKVDKQNKQNKQDDFMYDEIWEVYVGGRKEPFILNEKEYAILSDAILKGLRGAIQFKDKLIIIPYVQSAYRVAKQLKPEYQLKPPKEKEITEEQRQRIISKIAEIRKQLGAKLSMERMEREEEKDGLPNRTQF